MKIDYLKRFLTLGIFYLSIAFLVFNCEKDDELFNPEPQAHKVHKHTSHHVVYKNEIQGNQKLLETLHKLKSYNCDSSVKEDSNVSSKLIYNETLNITIDDESAIYFESNNSTYHSYTFQAIDHEHPYGVQNVVITLMPDGSYKELLVRYEVEGEEEQAFRNGETIDLTGKVSYAVLENGSFASTVLNKVTTVNDCITITEGQAGSTCTGQQQHTWEQRYSCPLVDQGNGPTQYIPFSVDIDYECIDSFNNTGNGESLPNEYNEYQDPNWVPADGASTVPYVSPIELVRRKVFRQISLIDELRAWFDNQSAEYKNDIYSFLESTLTPNEQLNNETYNELGIDEATLNIWDDYISDPTDPKWIAQQGMLQNNPALKYSHYYHYPDGKGTTFLLKDGSRVLESNVPRRINTDSSTVTALPSSEPPLDGNWYYIKGGDDDSWYEFALPVYGINFECLSCKLNELASKILENGLVITGRYFIPAEDVLILIHGVDFYGAEQSRAVAGAFILMEVIPGSDLLKLLKITKYTDEAAQVVETVIKIADETFKKQKKIVNSVLSGDPDYALDLYNNTRRKGNFGEIVTDVKLYEKGYEPLHIRIDDIDQTITQGIDAIFKNPNTGEFIIIESKFGTSTLSTLADGTKQMSQSWIEDGTRLVDAVGAELAEEILDSGYKSVLANINESGEVVYQLLNSAAESIGSWTP